VKITAEDREALRRAQPDLGEDQLDLFARTAERAGLDPFSNQIYAVLRWDKRRSTYVMTIQTGIDGYRAAAEMTGDYAGQVGPEWCGADGVWRQEWLYEEPPLAARVGVLRHTFTAPLHRVAHWHEFVQTDYNNRPTSMWARMPRLMLAKVAEAQALRAAFPRTLSGIYTADEMAQADSETPAASAPSRPAQQPAQQAAQEAAQEAGEELDEQQLADSDSRLQFVLDGLVVRAILTDEQRRQTVEWLQAADTAAEWKRRLDLVWQRAEQTGQQHGVSVSDLLAEHPVMQAEQEADSEEADGQPEQGTGEADSGSQDAAQPAQEGSTFDAPIGWDELTVDQLRDEARARGLTVSGTKDELIERLEAADQEVVR